MPPVPLSGCMMADEDDQTAFEKVKEELVKALIKKRQTDKQLVGQYILRGLLN